MASYDYLDQLIENAKNLDESQMPGSLSDIRAKTNQDTISLYKRPEYLQKQLDLTEKAYNDVKAPTTDLASQMILAFAPAVAGAIGGESAAIAAPKVQEQARQVYGSVQQEQKQAAAEQKKALLDKYNKILTIDKDAAENFLKSQKLLQDRDIRNENLEFKKQQLAQQADLAKENQSIKKMLIGSQIEKAQDRAQERLSKEQKLSDKQLESINDIDTAKSDLQNILDLKESRNISSGQIAGRIPEFFAGEDVAAFRSALGRYKDQYRKAITGAGAGPTEIAMLEKRLPNETDQPENFVAKAKEAQVELDRRKRVYLSNLEKQGKKTDQFREESASASSGFTDEKAKRLQELRAKAASGKLGQ